MIIRTAHLKRLAICTALLLMGYNGIAQQTNPPKNKLDKALISFYTGSWTGQGQFSNGKVIEADVMFQTSLDSCWLTYQHTDKAPNQYKATSMWGVDRLSGNFVAYIFDNFQGHRQFTGSQTDHQLVLTRKELRGGKNIYEHFVYQMLDKNRFKMTYELSADSITWREGDHLIFIKNTK